ncbi:MAG: hypothetical protein ACYS8I_10650 [Planctomycetota bacterium]|jgi:hypothetical protein
MALLIKQGVRVGRGPSAQLLLALMVARDVYADYDAECVITSLDDGKHRERSRHYMGDGVDLRVKHISMDKADEIYDELQHRLMALGPEYLVIREYRGEANDHIHVHYAGRRSDR